MYLKLNEAPEIISGGRRGDSHVTMIVRAVDLRSVGDLEEFGRNTGARLGISNPRVEYTELNPGRRDNEYQITVTSGRRGW
jgi:hypothetical protein